MTYQSGRLEITATLLSPLHHGAGTSGNTQLLATMTKIDPRTGEEYDAPYVSGNSLKHLIRDGGVRHALDAMGIEDGVLSREVINLLFSGGNLTSGGNTVDLDRARRVAELFPILSICGYSAGNWMEASKISCDILDLVCAENAWALPAKLQEHPVALLSCEAFRDEGFGTRHDPMRQPAASRRLAGVERKLLDVDMSDRHARKQKSKKKEKKKTDTIQMIFDFETVRPGAVFSSCIRYRDLSELEIAALKAALSYMCEGVAGDGGYLMRFGAKGSIGMGRASVTFEGSIHRIVSPTTTPSEALLPVPAADAKSCADLDDYTAHLLEHREEILDLLRSLV
jgi:hypothetical protein